MTSKFFDIFATNGGLKTVNADNIAIIETTQDRIKTTLNIKNENGEFIVFYSINPMTPTSNYLLKDDN